MRRLVVWVALLAALLTIAEAGQAQQPDEGVQLFLVLDVSGSMNSRVYGTDIPEEVDAVLRVVADLQNQVERIESDAELQGARQALEFVLDSPEVTAARDALSRAIDDISAYLAAKGLGATRFEMESTLRAGLRDLGCDEFVFASMTRSADLAEADGWIDFGCPTAPSADDRAALLDLISFIEDPDWQSLDAAEALAVDAFDTAEQTAAVPLLEEAVRDREEALGLPDIEAELEAAIDDLMVEADAAGIPSRLDLAKAATHTLLDLSDLDLAATGLPTGLGLAVFSDEPELLTPLTEDLDAIDAAVDLLEPRDRTNISGGLTVALDELARDRDPDRPAAIILLSDGHANEGLSSEEMIDQIPLRADELNTVLCTVGFATNENEVDKELLETLASETGGEYLFAESGADLASFFLSCRARLLTEDVERATAVTGSEFAEVVRVTVPANSCQLVATVAHPGTAPEVTLTRPDGTSLTEGDEGIDAQSASGLLVLRIADPASGDWVISARADKSILFSVVLSVEECVAVVAAPEPEPPPDEGGGGFPVVLIVALVVAAGGAGWWFLTQRNGD